MTRFYILRHAETSWNLEGNRYCGRTDIPLSPTGREQAQWAAHALREVPFAAAFCSPLQRSRETATIIAGERGLSPACDALLLEVDFGAWEGLTRGEIETTDPAGWAGWLRDPAAVRAGGTGETGQEAAARIDRFVRDTAAVCPNETVLVVGHNTLNRLYLAASLEVPLRNYRRLVQGNTGINVLELADGEPRWVQINETAHLRR
ncbi:MAG: histidine phosphatase family protein [Chloroflexota bacterium]|nr:histidine phosphatase family protein [Chloroflexota bacterium]